MNKQFLEFIKSKYLQLSMHIRQKGKIKLTLRVRLCNLVASLVWIKQGREKKMYRIRLLLRTI